MLMNSLFYKVIQYFNLEMAFLFVNLNKFFFCKIIFRSQNLVKAHSRKVHTGNQLRFMKKLTGLFLCECLQVSTS